MQHFPGIFTDAPNILVSETNMWVMGMTDKGARIGNIKTLVRLLADIEEELKATGLSGKAFLAELRELRQQCDLELALLEKREEEVPTDEG